MVRWYPKGVDDKIPTQGLCDFIVISSDRQTIFSHKALNWYVDCIVFHVIGNTVLN